MCQPDTDTDEPTDDKKSLEQRVKEHVERNRAAYIKMGTVDEE